MGLGVLGLEVACLLRNLLGFLRQAQLLLGQGPLQRFALALQAELLLAQRLTCLVQALERLGLTCFGVGQIARLQLLRGISHGLRSSARRL